MSFVMPNFHGFVKSAGSSTLWTPSQLDNIIGGYTAKKDGSNNFQGTESSGEVSQWDDIYGTNHLTQTNSEFQPTWDSTNEVLSFSRNATIADYFHITSSSIKTIVLVYANLNGDSKVNSVASSENTSDGELWLGGSSGIGANAISFDNAGSETGRYSIAGDSWSSYAENHSTSDHHSNNFGLFEWQNNQDIIYIGRRAQSDYGYEGDMYYLLLLSDTLTSTEKEKLEGWLAHEFGYTSQLPTNHPYKSSAPTI